MAINITRRAEETIARCRAIAACTEIVGETTRTFLAPSMHEVHDLLRGWMQAAGMQVYIDAIGNLRGVYPARSEKSARLILGSHLDTVPNAGAFDGILGVVLSVALVEALGEASQPFTIEIVGFSEEEGVRFAKPYLGSLAFIGALDEETLCRTDAQGVSVADAVRSFDLNPETIPESVVNDDAFAYVEVHIEQGPVLESEGQALGIVTAIAGQTRMHLKFTGHANHAGTTPMHLRHDAMAAAAEWISSVEGYALSIAGLTATVGKVQTRPGAGNVIAGEVTATLDVRHAEDAIRRQAVDALLASARHCSERRGVQANVLSASHEDAVATDLELSAMLKAAALDAGYSARPMVSGAGHDARIVAARLPVAMLFLRSPGGLSHHPDESVLVEDVAAALATSLAFIHRLAEVKTELPAIARNVYA